MTQQPILRRESHFGRMMRCFTDRPLGIDAMLREAAARRPHAMAVIWEDARLSYCELNAQVGLLASNLAAQGLGPGDRVGLLVGNRPEFLLVVLAAARLGAIVVPMNIRQRRPEIAYMLTHSGASILIFEESCAAEAPDRADAPMLRARFVVGRTQVMAEEPFETLLTPSGHTPTHMPINEEAPFCILYTSGTTGKPKGAVLTHLGAVHSVLHYQYALKLREADIAALAAPASHVTGLVAILLPMLRVAGTTIMLSTFKADAFLDVMARERVNYTLLVPAMYNLCLRTPGFATRDLAAWRVGGYGGAPMPVAVIERLAEALPGLALSNIYGATETTSPTSVLAPSEAIARADTVGRPLPCADVLVVDDRGCEVAPGERGELLIGGPMTVPGYWDDVAANASSFVAGYWKSGDVGSIDADGYLRIHDRMKDVVNRGGYKVYSVEVENVIAQCPGVIECAVLGYPDSVLGERVAAFIRMDEAAEPSQQAIRQFCAIGLSDYKVPEAIVFLSEPLPRNANGKVLKANLRQRLIDGGAAVR